MSSPNPWLKFLDDDLKVLNILEGSDAFRGQCFHAQQLVEKLLKAELHKEGMAIPKIHDVLVLADRMNLDLPVSREELEFLSSVYIESRYPTDIGLLPQGEPTQEDAEQALSIARKVYDALYPRIIE